MAHWLRALDVFTEDPDLIPSTHLCCTSICNFGSRGPDACTGTRHTCGSTQSYIQAKHHTYKIIIKNQI